MSKWRNIFFFIELPDTRSRRTNYIERNSLVQINAQYIQISFDFCCFYETRGDIISGVCVDGLIGRMQFDCITCFVEIAILWLHSTSCVIIAPFKYLEVSGYSRKNENKIKRGRGERERETRAESGKIDIVQEILTLVAKSS